MKEKFFVWKVCRILRARRKARSPDSYAEASRLPLHLWASPSVSGFSLRRRELNPHSLGYKPSELTVTLLRNANIPPRPHNEAHGLEDVGKGPGAIVAIDVVSFVVLLLTT